MAEWWCVILPTRLNPYLPQITQALTDGIWTAGRPRVAGYGPLITLALGFLAPFLIPGMRNVYTESLFFLFLAVVLPVVSGALGITFFLGFVAGDLLSDLARGTYQFQTVRALGGQSVSYLLLALLMVRLPLLARRLASGIPLRQKAAQAGLTAIAYGLLVYLWCQATIVLIRPVFTWVHHSPTVAAIENVQTRWQWLVAAGMAAVVVRYVMELLTAGNAARSTAVAELTKRSAKPEEQGEAWSGVPVVLRVLMATLAVILLLAGTYESWIDAGLVAIMVGFLGSWRARILWQPPDSWTSLTGRVPALVRFAMATLIGFFLARLAIGTMWDTQGLRPVMVGALLTLVVFYLLFPQRSWNVEE